jgi:hypothetical protein
MLLISNQYLNILLRLNCLQPLPKTQSLNYYPVPASNWIFKSVSNNSLSGRCFLTNTFICSQRNHIPLYYFSWLTLRVHVGNLFIPYLVSHSDCEIHVVRRISICLSDTCNSIKQMEDNQNIFAEWVNHECIYCLAALIWNLRMSEFFLKSCKMDKRKFKLCKKV